jgi:pimeloyl-ACP methyl ester carboxylesterase
MGGIVQEWINKRPKSKDFPDGAEWIAQTVSFDSELETDGRLQKGMASFFVPAQGVPRGVCILEHGVTGGPYQYWELAEKLSRAGLHCYGPRLPGHGLALTDGQPDAGDLPKSDEFWRYAAAAEAHFQAAGSLADQAQLPINMIGLSAGCVLVLHHVIHHHAKIRKIALVAPYFGPADFKARLMLSITQKLDFGGRLGRLLDTQSHAWDEHERANAMEWGRPGHWDFVMGNLYAVEKSKTAALKALADQKIQLPTWMLIVSDADKNVSPDLGLEFAQVQHAQTVLRFEAERQVPHAMLTSMENPDDTSRNQVHDAIVNFLVAGP